MLAKILGSALDRPRFMPPQKNNNRYLNAGVFGKKNGCFPLKEIFFPLAAAFFSKYFFDHFGGIFGRNSVFIFDFVKFPGFVQHKEVITMCFV